MRNRSVTVRVPASTSNLGSGFDTLGLALNLYCSLVIRRSKTKGVSIVSEISATDSASANAMIEETASLFFKTVQKPHFGIEVEISSEIPAARGLGASAAIRVGVLAGLGRLSGAPLERADLLEMATALEHHPDNASPAIFGGFTVSGTVNHQVRCIHFPVSPKLQLVTLVPDLQISTQKARTLLPNAYSKAATAHALNRCGLITAAFASQDYELLRGLFDDRMHQPFRQQLLPLLSSVIESGTTAGALGGFLSGSGSAIICLARRRHVNKVKHAMAHAFGGGTTTILKTDNRGLVVKTN
ncbi:MAG: homoserine kinase [Verrucomicrobiales bacterium]|nr:homoserine kinase [Verrucomicrobiales bacterium]